MGDTLFKELTDLMRHRQRFDLPRFN